ncbi:MAG: hypothetical protein K2G66_03830 [Alistipes sp.]|nr:hypothetical protein [Alistipes sp.]
MITQPLVALLEAGINNRLYAADTATIGMYVLIVVIGIVGYIVHARLESVFKKY